MQNCWPDWDGPKAGGRCEVHKTMARNITQGASRYHYMAPCEILMEVDDEWICRIDYPPNTPCADLYNGQLLRLPITNIWPPVHILSGRGIISTE